MQRIPDIVPANGMPCLSTVVEEVCTGSNVPFEQSAIATFCSGFDDSFALQDSINGSVIVACSTAFFELHDVITHVGPTSTTLMPVVQGTMNAATCIALLSRFGSTHGTACVRFTRTCARS